MVFTQMEGEGLLAWIEIGRAAPENEAWVAWIALENADTTLYRCLISAGETALVTIDLQRNGLEVLARSVMLRLQSEREGLAAAREIEQSAERLRALANSIPDIAWSAGPDGRPTL